MQRPPMIDERSNDARENGRTESRFRRHRLAWRWRATGTTGHGPWMHRAEVLEAWLESLNRRYLDEMEHWIESEPDPALKHLR